jgi:phosphoglycerol transferase MdoB-like AlkP superfamily enzyme
MHACRTKLRFTLAVFLAATAAFLIFRVAFLGYFEGFRPLATGETWRAFYLGLKFDLRLAAILVMPVWLLLQPGDTTPPTPRRDLAAAFTLAAALVLYAVMVVIAMADEVAARKWLGMFLALALVHRLAFRSYGLSRNPSARGIWMGFAAALVLALSIAYFADFGTYGYIHTRLNGNLLMFAENAGTSLRMVWESYPVLRLLLVMALLLAGTGFGLRRLARGMTLTNAGPWRRWITAVAGTLFLLVCMYGKWSRYPLRWAEAFEVRNAFNAQLALNPVLFFLETRAEMDGGYDLDKVKASHAAMADYFGIPIAFDQEGLPTLRREGRPFGHLDGEPNVVFIQLESLAAFKTGIGGNPLAPTPYLDRLSRKGLYFDRFHVVMENTSRSMFATLFGIPDVSSVQNATRNPLLVDQHSVLEALPYRDRSYWLGGSANWAQIRGVLRNNFKGLEIREEGSYPGVPVVDVWGVSDADLLQAANAELATRTRPFWAYIQTSGNHPPFTVPEHLKDFRLESRSEAELKAAGFVSLEEYNAVRLMDYSLQKFFEAAQRAPYFRNTVFLLWADHGVPRGCTDTRFGDLGLAVHRIPFVIYAPGLLKEPKRIHTIGSQMDILPTLMSLLGRPYRHQTLGQDLLDPRWENKAAAFTFTTFRRPPRLGLIQGDYYVNLEPDGRPSLYRLDEANPRDLAPQDPERTARMKALAEGFHHWSRYLLSHNKPLEAKP